MIFLLISDVSDIFFDVSDVSFRKLSEDEIRTYVDKYKPMDKAGSYGIQEWVGLTGIERINGSYTNVVGLQKGVGEVTGVAEEVGDRTPGQQGIILYGLHLFLRELRGREDWHARTETGSPRNISERPCLASI